MDLVTTDIETYYDKQYSLRRMTAEEYIRNPLFEFVGASAKLNDQPTQVLFTDNRKRLREWYLDQFPLKAMWVGHNMSGFDSLALTHHLGVHPKFWQCTLAMGRLLHGHRSVSLANLAPLYGLGDKGTVIKDMEGKRLRDLTPSEIVKYSAYCVQDTNLCYQLYQYMLPKVPPEELRIINLFVRMFAEPRILLDEYGLREYKSELITQQEKVLQRAAKAAGISEENYNDDEVKKLLRSDAKFAKLLEEHGVDPPRKISPRTGKEAYAFAKTDRAMSELQEHTNHDVAVLAAARVGVKSSIEQSRVDRFISISERGKLPALFLYGKTHTNRAAGGGKINLQNMTRSKPVSLKGDDRTPIGTLIDTTHGATRLRARNVKDKLVLDTEGRMHAAQHVSVYGLRHGLLAAAGYTMVVSDSSNIELRVAHTLSGQMDVVERLRRKEDMYCWFAGELYGYPVNKKEHPFERFHGKVGMLQLQYQSGWKGFVNAARGFGLKVNQYQGQETVNVYRSLFPYIVAAWKTCETAIAAMEAGERFALDQWGLCCTEHNAIVLPNKTRMYYHNLRREAKEDGHGWEWVYDDKENRAPRKLYGGKLFENLCQALARIIVFSQMLQIEQRWGRWTPDGMDTGVVLTAHDEVVTIVKHEDAQECLRHSLDVMKTPPAWWPQIPLDAEGDAAACYGAAK